MKTFKILFTLVAVSGMFSFCSAQDKLPQNIKDSFAKKFPMAKSVKWDMESETEWEAEFKMNKREYSANYLADGTWMETEHEIEDKDIPAAVKNSLAQSFSGYKTKEMEMSETKSGMVYEFELKKGESEMEVAIDASGKVTKKEIKSEDNDEDND